MFLNVLCSTCVLYSTAEKLLVKFQFLVPTVDLLVSLYNVSSVIYRELNLELHTSYSSAYICTTKDGQQKVSNLSVSQQIGIRSLSRKVARKEVVILEAGKGKRFVVMKEEMYLAMAQNHIQNEIPTTPTEVRESQRILSTTAKSLVNTVNLLTSHSHSGYARCFDNWGSMAEDVPKMRLLPKTHKSLGPLGHPQSRPVVSAATGMSSRARDVLADIMEPLVELQLPRMEDKSTEEVIAQLEEEESAIRESGCDSIMVGSLDVKDIYPSLDIEQSAEIVSSFVYNIQDNN